MSITSSFLQLVTWLWLALITKPIPEGRVIAIKVRKHGIRQTWHLELEAQGWGFNLDPQARNRGCKLGVARGFWISKLAPTDTLLQKDQTSYTVQKGHQLGARMQCLRLGVGAFHSNHHSLLNAFSPTSKVHVLFHGFNTVFKFKVQHPSFPWDFKAIS